MLGTDTLRCFVSTDARIPSIRRRHSFCIRGMRYLRARTYVCLCYRVCHSRTAWAAGMPSSKQDAACSKQDQFASHAVPKFVAARAERRKQDTHICRDWEIDASDQVLHVFTPHHLRSDSDPNCSGAEGVYNSVYSTQLVIR
jgi:hypothetical protein